MKKRLKEIKRLWKRYHIVPGDTSTTAGEDAGELLEKVKENKLTLLRFLVVTRAGEFTYAHRTYETLYLASRNSTNHADDFIWAEVPFAIHDLDTGKSYEPIWSSLKWEAA